MTNKNQPKRVLFACTMNSIRSPMAAALTRAMHPKGWAAESCGVYEGYLDPFMVQAMEEWDVDLSGHQPRTYEDFDLAKFDLIVALTHEATHRARELVEKLPRKLRPEIEYWETQNPTDQMFGPRDMRLQAYTDCRDELKRRIKERF